MAPTGDSRRAFSPRALVIIGIAVIVVLAGLIALFAPKEPSGARRAVEAKLAELRAKGVPVTAEEIGRALPDPQPERDARVLLSDAFSFSRGLATKNVPIVSDAMPQRTAAIPEATMQDMQVYLANSDQRLAAIPRDLTGVRFSMGWTNGFTNLLRHSLVEVRRLEQDLAIKSLYESACDNHRTAAECLAKGFAVAGTLKGDLAHSMVRVASAALMCDAAEQALNRVQFTAGEVRQIDEQVRPEDLDDFKDCFMVERHLGVLTFNHMRQSTRGWRGILANVVHRFKGGKLPLYRDEDYLLFLNFNERQIELHPRALLERLNGYQQLTTDFATNSRSLSGGMVMPSWSNAMRTAAETKARLVALKAALAIERFRFANNNLLPATLEALVPDYCPSVPRDPFDGGPLRYKKLGRGYVVYSIGHDGVDNDGFERRSRKNLGDYDVTITVER